MLTVDLVRAYRRGNKLMLATLKPADRERVEELAARYLAITRAHIGQTRGALTEALAGVPFSARDRKLAGGLRKLLVDRCQFLAATEHDPVELRRLVFERAGRARRKAAVGDAFDRQDILADVAADLHITVDDERAAAGETPAERLESLLYTDLKQAHRLLSFTGMPASRLVDAYQEGQAQAVLLRAHRVVVRVFLATPADLRALFRKLKFLRLLYTVERMDDGGYRLVVDGPYSLFRSVTKYGLGLALMLPALRACERWSLEAEVEWGKKREPLHFQLESSGRADADEPARLPDEVQALLDKFAERRQKDKTDWDVARASDVLSLPGVGLCVPDLMFVHQQTGECVYLEVMGFWSRDAVWKRVELVESGLPDRIIFAVSSRLRVSESALDPDLPAALYVYKGTINVRAIEERLERLTAGRG